MDIRQMTQEVQAAEKEKAQVELLLQQAKERKEQLQAELDEVSKVIGKPVTADNIDSIIAEFRSRIEERLAAIKVGPSQSAGKEVALGLLDI
jgi:predicted  nucleic acid-binding Zn-ribbon protein